MWMRGRMRGSTPSGWRASAAATSPLLRRSRAREATRRLSRRNAVRYFRLYSTR